MRLFMSLRWDQTEVFMNDEAEKIKELMEDLMELKRLLSPYPVMII